MVGRCLERCGVDGVVQQEADSRLPRFANSSRRIRDDAEMVPKNATAKEALQDK